MRRLILSILLLILPCAVAAAEPAQPDALLARLQQKAAGVKTLQSDFTQEKHLAMFKEVLLSRGRFVFGRPDRLRWEIVEPVGTGFVIAGGKGRRWHARTGRSEPFTLEREPVMKLVAEQLLAWAGADFDLLRRQYKIRVVSEEPAVLRLEPLAPGQGFLDHLQVAFAPGGGYMTAVEVHEKGGDYTRIRFQEPVVNGAVAEDLFR